MLINKKKRICYQVDFTVPADDRMKIKGSEKIEKYLDISKKWTTLQPPPKKKTKQNKKTINKLCNIRMAVIPIFIGTIGSRKNWKKD